MGAEDDVLPFATSYMRIISLGMLFTAGSMALTSALRGAGDTKTPMTINLVANGVNVIGNFVLIYGHLGLPALGINGAAIATSIARVVSCLMALYAVMNRGSLLRLSLAPPYKVELGLLERLFQIGLPATGEQLALRTGQILYLRIVAGLGTTTVATHQIGMNILSLSFMPGQAFSIAATTLVGQQLGTKRPDIAEQCALETRKLDMLVSGAAALFFFSCGSLIARLYTTEQEIISQTAMVLEVVALIQPAQSTQFNPYWRIERCRRYTVASGFQLCWYPGCQGRCGISIGKPSTPRSFRSLDGDGTGPMHTLSLDLHQI
jgi:putative MATE family efflux protein